MEYKKKLKKRLYWSLTWSVIGLALVLAWSFAKVKNEFLFSFGAAMLAMGVVRTIQYRKVTRDEKSIRQQEVAENDERYQMMSEKAKSWAFSYYLTITGFAVIIASVLGYQEQVLPYAWSICGLTALYWICWLFAQKKY